MKIKIFYSVFFFFYIIKNKLLKNYNITNIDIFVFFKCVYNE